MKILILLGSFILVSCSVETNRNKIIAQEINIDTSKIEITKKENPNYSLNTWKEHQDSLRKLILESKSNVILKSNFFQEFYIKGFVNQVEDKIEFDLPFDLHSFDCGAPDCYSTTLNFAIPIKNPIEFPKQITCDFLEKGCGIEKDFSKKIDFQLVESSPTYVNYYAEKDKANLILIGDKQNSNLYYFTDVKPNLIKINLINKILEEYDDENPNSIVPYRSSIMLKQEYEHFIEK